MPPAETRVIRVLHVIWNLAGGGAERVVLDLCRLAPADIEPTVQPLAAGGALVDAFRSAGVRVRKPITNGSGMGPAAVLRLAREARRHDVVHTHLWAGDAWGRIAARCAGRPVVTTEHNSRPDTDWRGRISSRMARLSRRVVCVSEAAAAASRLQGVPAARLEVIPNGVDLGRFDPLPVPEGTPPRLLFMGRLVPQKGVDVLFEALAGIQDVPGLEARVLGDGPMRASLDQHPLVRRGIVRMLGWQSDPGPHLAWCSLVVMPSRWEGFGLVMVEALASGRPVVASEVDSLPSLVGDAGWLVMPDQPRELARAIEEALRDPDELRARAARGPARAAAHGSDMMVARYADLWRELHAIPRRVYNDAHG